MSQDFFIKRTFLINLYKRLELYIMSNYPDIIITVNSKSVSLAYPGEWARIFIYQNRENNALIVRLTQDLTSKMDTNNGIQFYLSSLEDLNSLKGAIRAILELKRCPISESDLQQGEESSPEDLPIKEDNKQPPKDKEQSPTKDTQRNSPRKRKFFQ